MLDALTLDQLRMFVAVAEAGSFRLAAARLGRAQSAVSHSVANLEMELGTPLFDRNSHRPVLTVEGRALLEDSRSLLLRADLLRAKARGMGSGLEIELTVMADTLFPVSIIGEALGRLHAAFPSVSVELRSGTLGQPAHALLGGTADIAITVGEDLRDSRLEFEALTPVSLTSVVGATHPLASRAKEARVSAVDLADFVQVVLVDPSGRTQGTDFGVLSQRRWRVGSQAEKLELIRAGVGWGRLPEWLIAGDFKEGRLVPLPAAALGKDGRTVNWSYIAHRLDKPLLPAAAFLRSALQEIAASEKTPSRVGKD
ncbi:MAG: LysR family transcriptional regulator [Mesorhizobium sp.]|uniref:LysR family transcriptional regulator n=1 Tax=Mesorhizobium sp. TaxID=1871066 RepID=UPI000FE45667|nr:LysR family transcriptional regulator [Mesorhizobium sp.]RWC97527.1 MAG: LysR family transcriptional regulator [Mesorhizobium sp.]TIW74998.1 MAG: LysR family transcriptional regulator [Mesorhizobium sp.]